MSTAQDDWDDIMGTKAKPAILVGSSGLLEETPIDKPSVQEAQRGLNSEAREIADQIPLGGTTAHTTKPLMTDDYTLFVPQDASEIQYHIASAVIQIGKMLLDKNRKYGNSALDPLRVHSQATPIEQLKVRADDKLSRLRSAQADDAEDALLDYIGYMILLYIAEKHND